MHFPVSGITVHPLILFAAAFGVSFFTSMGGVSGAVLLLPFQMSILGYAAPSVSSTNQVFNIVAIPSGVYRYIREGRMLWPLTWAVIVGTLPGVFIGAWIRIRYLPDARTFKLFVGLVLGYIGIRLLMDVLEKRGRQQIVRSTRAEEDHNGVSHIEATLRKVSFAYGGESYQFSPLTVYVICFLVGVIGGIYGIGGGAIVAPFFVAIVGLPVHVVAGPALMGTFITSVAGVAFYQTLAWLHPDMSIAPDWLLGLLFGLGGCFGMYFGARTQKYVPARIIKGILCGCVVLVGIRYIFEYFR